MTPTLVDGMGERDSPLMLLMQSLSAIEDSKYVMNIYWESLELTCMHEATRHMVCILDLQNAVNKCC